MPATILVCDNEEVLQMPSGTRKQFAQRVLHRLRRPAGRSRGAVVATFLLLSAAPLGLLAYVSVSSSESAVRERVARELESSSKIGALYISEQLRGLAEVDAAFAGRPFLIRALGGGSARRYDRAHIRSTLNQLVHVRKGIGTAFLADTRGRLIDIVPPTPSIIGKDFSFRDWYRGVTRTGEPYVSEAYRSQAAGHPLVVAVAAPVRAETPAGTRGKRLAILVVAYRLATIQSFAQRFAKAQGVSLLVTDQRGVVVADGQPRPRLQAPALADPRVAAALAGRSGITEGPVNGIQTLSAHTPLPQLGWTLTAQIPAAKAYGEVRALGRRVVLVSALLALVLLSGAWLLNRLLRQRQAIEAELAEALQEAEHEASIRHAVLDAAADGIRLVDLEGKTMVANAAIEKMTTEVFGLRSGLTLAERSDAILERLVDPEQYGETMRAIAADPEGETLDEFELAESGRAFRRYTGPVRGASSSLVGRIITLREVTAEKQAERLKSELVSTVSHELRTPLASILGFAELLAQRDYDDETRKRHLATIHSEAWRLTNLINDFLDLQRIEEGSFRLRLERVSLEELLRGQVTLFGAQSGEHELELDLPEEPLEVLAEPERICQVVANLLSNAIKYSPRGGRVHVRAAKMAGAVRVAVRDEGIGIPAAQQQQIFTKFFRVDSSDTRAIGGTGLGLALCHEIVHSHGGRIGFDSVEGEGSTFWFELPAARPGSGEGGPRVLVIEDDPAASSLIADLLATDGYAVEIAASGGDAIARAKADPPALVCLDITLADEIDGWQVLAGLKSAPATAAVPVIVCTAGNNRAEAATLGAADFLTKPFSAAQLRATVARLVPSAGDARVLVVDDEANVRGLVFAALEGEGWNLAEAADGEEALAAVAARRPDVIVLDLMMPTLDGFAVLERLQERAETRSIPVVVLTARRLSDGDRTWLNERAVALLEKSGYSAEQLRTLIHRALGDHTAVVL